MSDDCDYAPEEPESDDSSKLNSYFQPVLTYDDSVESDSTKSSHTPNINGKKRAGIQNYTSALKKISALRIIYQCSLCSFQSNVRHKLKRHFTSCLKASVNIRNRPRDIVTTNARFKCEYCFFETHVLNDLIQHKETHADFIEMGLIQCSHCNLNFFTIEECRIHMKAAVFGDPTLADDTVNLYESDDYVDTPEYVNNRSEIFSENENITIKIEDFSDDEVVEVEATKAETKLVTQDTSMEISSKKTPKEREKPIILFDEFNCELSKENGLYSCPCKKFKTKYRSNYLRHLKCTHHVKVDRKQGKLPELATDPVELLCCPVCHREAKSHLELVVHMALDHTETECPFHCIKPRCSFVTEHKGDLKLHLKVAHNMTKSMFDLATDQPSFICAICDYEARSDQHLMAHVIDSHAKSSDAPFDCPDANCGSNLQTKNSLRWHMKLLHHINLRTQDDIMNPESDCHEAALTCQKCGTKWETEFHLKIHKSTNHIPKTQKTVTCPVSECFHTTTYTHHLRRHLIKVHKLGPEYFRDSRSTSFEKRSMKIEECGNMKILDGVILVDYIEDVPFQCEKKGSVWQLQQRVERKCDICQKTLAGTFQLFWHNYSVHRKIAEYNRWKLTCTICTFKGWTEDSCKHGAIHQSCKVTFQTSYLNVPVGRAKFRYEGIKTARKLLVTNVEAENDVEDCIAPSAIKVLDWTVSDDEETANNTLVQLQNEEFITIEFADSDNETKKETIRSDPDNDLLVMKCSLLTCKECTYETQDQSLLNIHKLLMHARWKSAKDEQYPCPQEGCEFQSQYKANFRRHLLNIHKFKLSDLLDVDAATPTAKETAKPIKTDADPEWDPTSDRDYQYSKRNFRCPEKSCSYSTNEMTKLLDHHHHKHNVLKFSRPRFVCPNNNCFFDTDKKHRLKRHLEVNHKIEEDHVIQMEEAILSMQTLACSKCDFHTKDSEEFKKHFRITHLHGSVKALGKSPTDVYNWEFKCSECSFKTPLKRAAYKHGSWHNTSTMTFRKYYKKKLRGCFKFRYASKNFRRCKQCAFVGSTKFELLKHSLQHHKSDSTPRGVRHKGMRDNRVMRQNRANSSSVKKIKRKFSEEREIRSITKQVKKKTEAAKDDDQNPKTYSDPVPYGLEDLQHIIGTPNETHSTKQTTIDDNWISALEEEILNENNTEENEVIRIEVTTDDDEIEDGQEQQINLNPFTGELDSDEKSSKGKRKFVCALCEEVLTDKESLQSHIVINHFISNIESPQETNLVISKPKPSRKNVMKKKRAVNKIPGRISYKCWMCGDTLFNRITLKSHTYVHAREDGDFNLKVRFSKFKGDTRVDTIAIKLEPGYLPRKSQNVPLGRPDLYRHYKIPTLDYNPSLPVFSCTHCNFKTNRETSLTKHNSLHWNADKEAAFKARKWFTCGVCFFHCFDAATFKEHGEKHKVRPPAPSNTDGKKVGKDSWSF